MRGPVTDVPVAPTDARAGQAVPLVVPGPSAGSGPAGSGTGAGPAAGASSGLSPGNAGGLPGASPRAGTPLRPPPLVLPSLDGPFRLRTPPRQKSLSEMANDQLRRGRGGDALANGIEDAGIADCLRDAKTAPLTGLAAAPALAVQALEGKCK